MPIIGNRNSIETTHANFGNLIRDDRLLIDKTFFLKEFFNDVDVLLITRPRRFGKTLMMSTTQHFFSAKVNGQSTAGLFNNLAIATVDNGAFLAQHQGKYPVIFITLKDVKGTTFAEAIQQLRELIQELYRGHREVLLSTMIAEDEKTIFKNYLNGTINNITLQNSLRFLSECLSQVHNHQQVIMLIDEYDSPLNNAYQKDFLEPLSDFLKVFFGSALKDNPFLKKGLMTGILRVSKNSMLSDLNNLETYTLLSDKYSQYFGFTEDEMNALLIYPEGITNMNSVLSSAANASSATAVSGSDLKTYYNGYTMGNTTIYNPWSTLTCLRGGELRPHWVLTANDGTLKKLFLKSDAETKERLVRLMQRENIEQNVSINLRYEELMESPSALWSYLLFLGYVTADSRIFDKSQWKCQLKIPNTEILSLYQEIFIAWLKEEVIQNDNFTVFLNQLTEGNIEAFTDILGNYLLRSLSYWDVKGKKTENFYHGFMAGLVASLGERYIIKSNIEAGVGRYDIIIVPKNLGHYKGIVLEFKHLKLEEPTKKSNAPTEEEINTLLCAAAETAVAQINTQKYTTALLEYAHLTEVVKVGLAFCEKAVRSCYFTTHLKQPLEQRVVQWTKLYTCNDDAADEESINNAASHSHMQNKKHKTRHSICSTTLRGAYQQHGLLGCSTNKASFITGVPILPHELRDEMTALLKEGHHFFVDVNTGDELMIIQIIFPQSTSSRSAETFAHIEQMLSQVLSTRSATIQREDPHQFAIQGSEFMLTQIHHELNEIFEAYKENGVEMVRGTCTIS